MTDDTDPGDDLPPIPDSVGTPPDEDGADDPVPEDPKED